MLEHIMQRHNECWITAVAMVTGQSIDVLRKRFEDADQQKRPYTEIVRERFYTGVPGVWRDVAGEIVKEHMARSTSTFVDLYAHPDIPAGGIEIKPRLLRSLLKGKGILSVWQRNRAHAVAFEDGVIYDGNAPFSMEFRTWKSYFNWTRIEDFRIDYTKEVHSDEVLREA